MHGEEYVSPRQCESNSFRIEIRIQMQALQLNKARSSIGRPKKREQQISTAQISKDTWQFKLFLLHIPTCASVCV